MAQSIYLDYAAATPMDPSVIASMQPYFNDNFYNPSALYLGAKQVAADVTEARQSIARLIGSKPSEIIFTAGGTEANNLAIRGVMEQFAGKQVVVGAIEHDSVLFPARNYNHREVAVDKYGVINLKDLESSITEDTVLVSIMYANNEVGSVQPLRDIARLIEKIKKQRLNQSNTLPLYFHTDAAQATNYLDMHVSKLGVDLMTVNGGKVYGPKQAGFLFVKTGTQLQPQILGGGQERSIRSGTENVAGIIGLSQAMTVVTERKKTEVERLKKLQQVFIDELEKAIPKVSINGSIKHRLPNNVHITIQGKDNERLLMELDEEGIQCATGSACSASNDEPSHVLAAIGLDEQAIRSSLRFTMGANTTEAEIRQVVEVLARKRL